MLQLEVIVENNAKIAILNFSPDPNADIPGGIIFHRGFDGLYLYKNYVLDEAVENCWSTFFKYYAPNLFGKVCLWDDINENVVYGDMFFEATHSNYVTNAYGYHNNVLAAFFTYRDIDIGMDEAEAGQMLSQAYSQDSYDVENVGVLRMHPSPVIYLFTSKR